MRVPFGGPAADSPDGVTHAESAMKLSAPALDCDGTIAVDGVFDPAVRTGSTLVVAGTA